MNKIKWYNVISPTVTVTFVMLKLFDQLDWSWLWILSPVWITFSVVVVATFLGLLGIKLLADSAPFDRRGQL